MPNKEIAAQLSISEGKLSRAAFKNILLKLGANDRTHGRHDRPESAESSNYKSLEKSHRQTPF